MRIVINGEPGKTAATTLAELVASLEMAEAAVATALNGDFIAATKRAATRLTEDDSVEIVTPRQGG